jgi:hypothetical protein
MSVHVMQSVAAPGDGHMIVQLHHTLVVLVGWGISHVGTTTFQRKECFVKKLSSHLTWL